MAFDVLAIVSYTQKQFSLISHEAYTEENIRKK